MTPSSLIQLRQGLGGKGCLEDVCSKYIRNADKFTVNSTRRHTPEDRIPQIEYREKLTFKTVASEIRGLEPPLTMTINHEDWNATECALLFAR